MKALMKYDAILVAGENKDSHNVCNQYKALLKLNDRYCIQYVIEALQRASVHREHLYRRTQDRS